MASLSVRDPEVPFSAHLSEELLWRSSKTSCPDCEDALEKVGQMGSCISCILTRSGGSRCRGG